MDHMTAEHSGETFLPVVPSPERRQRIASLLREANRAHLGSHTRRGPAYLLGAPLHFSTYCTAGEPIAPIPALILRARVARSFFDAAVELHRAGITREIAEAARNSLRLAAPTGV